MVTAFFQLRPKPFIDERPEVFGPENNGVHAVSRSRHDGDALVKRIDDLKKSLADLLHEPGHVEGGDIGSSGSGDDGFVGRIHFGHGSARINTD